MNNSLVFQARIGLLAILMMIPFQYNFAQRIDSLNIAIDSSLY